MTTKAISRALGNLERSYSHAKATATRGAHALIASGGGGGDPFGKQFATTNTQEQLDSFRNWVFAAIRPIANTIAAQEIQVSRGVSSSSGMKRKALDYEVIENHPLVGILQNPNNLMTGYGLMWASVAALNLTGKAFWLVAENEIYMLPPSWVKGHVGTTSIESWKVLPPGQSTPINVPAEQMVYFAMPSPGDPWGVSSPLQSAGAAVDADDNILASQRSTFKNGLLPTHALIVGSNPHPEVPGGIRPKLTREQQRQITSAIAKRYQDVSKHGLPLILDGLISDVKSLSTTPSEMNWTESANQMKERILQAIGTSPYILGSAEPGSRAASAMAEKHFLKNTVNPLIRLMSAALTEWLAPIFSSDNEKLKIQIVPAVPDDAEMNLKWAEMLAKNSSVTAEELRQLSPFDLQTGPHDEWDMIRPNANRQRSIDALIDERITESAIRPEVQSILDRIQPSANGN